MMYLAEDITRQILLRLPVKSLLGLTCVCSTWQYLIFLGQFIDSHTQVGHRMEIVLSSGNNLSGNLEVRSLDHILEPYFESMGLSKTLQLKDNYMVIGHYNGIICSLWIQTLPSTILLWNPAIRQCRALPPADHYCTEGLYFHCIGFNYDALNLDYNMAIVSWDRFRLMTYSLKNDSWKSINSSSLKLDHAYYFPEAYSFPDACGLFFEGRLYWICVKMDELEEPAARAYCLLVFDLAKEELLELDLSDAFIPRNHAIADALGIFRGCISLLIQRLDCEAHSFEIWSMEGHFIPHSWIGVVDRSSMALAIYKKFLVSLELEHNPRSIGLTRDGKLFADLCEDGESYLALYNVEPQKMDVHKRREFRTMTIDLFDISTFREIIDTPALIKNLGTLGWFATSDFIETLVAVARILPRGNLMYV